jgi:hypothetical protein
VSTFLVSVVVLLVVAAVIRMSPDEPAQVATSQSAPDRAGRPSSPRLPSSVSLLLLSVALGAFVALVVVASFLVLVWTWRVSGL